MKKVIVLSLFCSLFNLEVNAVYVGDAVHPMARLSERVESSIGKLPTDPDLIAVQGDLRQFVADMEVETCPAQDRGYPEFFIYRPKQHVGRLPCLVYLHGGDTEAPFRITNPEHSIGCYYTDVNYITAPLLPMIKAIIDRGFAVATITFNARTPMTTQIINQVNTTLEKGYIDKGRTFIMGHSFGGICCSSY